jgi:AcrR family transcriptional regulator
MATSPRRERERAEREQLIVTTARDLAEAEGWDAVTTRRLAATIEYSQPVLYSHFSGKEGIMAAAALEGFTELADHLHQARAETRDLRQALTRIAEAYFGFADEKPALYDAMFTLTTELPFASPDSPQPLQDAYAEFFITLSPLVPESEAGTYTETFWAALHGLITLERSRRLPSPHRAARIGMLVDRFASPTSGRAAR